MNRARGGTELGQVGGWRRAWRGPLNWSRRRWLVAAGAALVFTVLVAIPTDLVPNPLFGREIAPTWWSWPALATSSLLGGLLVATYVDAPSAIEDQGRRRGWVGGLLTYFAVGCPVCNKLVLLLLGSAGALTWFEPVQPFLQLLAVVLLLWALHVRLKGELSCPVTTNTLNTDHAPSNDHAPSIDTETPVSGGSSHA
ncbi:hypothetical protein FB381_4367 [Nocardioides albertanoniae]|uniref:Uncharacterized protein n=1 Tax=Nocardioides albertanoniae TaxID=1175486 RepID=A0A543ACY1_9ACTN|nr:hypothetical protein FB381_4367 [Nocardioides albertanoniae]